MTKPGALFLPPGTSASQVTCTDVEELLFNFLSPPPPAYHVIFPYVLHIPGITYELQIIEWLNNSSDLRVKKLGCKVVMK